MKKMFLILCSCIVLLSGCGKNKVEEPYQVNIDGHILSYYDTKDTIDEEIQSKIAMYEEDKIGDADGNSPIEIGINEDGNIRVIIINSPDIVCYPNISVGDSKTRLERAFSYKTSLDKQYIVLYDISTEEDNGLLVDVKLDDNNKASKIYIYDVLYAETMGGKFIKEE